MSFAPGGTALAPFRIRSFRFQWPADLATAWAFEMEIIILGWYMLVETGSVLWLTAFGALTFLGTLFAPMFGIAGDRFGFRNMLCLMRAAYLGLAATLALLLATGTATPPLVFAIAFVAGLIRPSDLTMRNLLVGQTMPPPLLMGAMGVSRTTMDSARIVGALAGAGAVAALGMAQAYVVVCGLYVASLLLTLGVSNGARAASAVPASPWSELRAGLVYVWTEPHLRAAMLLAFLVNLTAFPLTGAMLAYTAKVVHGLDQSGLAYLSASFATGALIGSVVLTVWGAAVRPGRTMLVGSAVWYALLFAFAHAPSPLAAGALLVGAGLAQSLSMVPLAVMLLRACAPAFRARVMGVRMLAVYGMTIGGLASGPLIERFGFGAMASAYTLFGLLCVVGIAWRWRSHVWRPDAPANR